MTDQELIHAVAEKVMGWKWRHKSSPIHAGWYEQNQFRLYNFNPLTNPAHWMLVVERMREDGWDFMLQWKQGSDWYPLFFHYPEWGKEYAHQDRNLGTAVCIAALKALEAQND